MSEFTEFDFSQYAGRAEDLIGTDVPFGRYPQSSNTPEPIMWRVLAGDNENNTILAISVDLLDARRFDPEDNDWESSELRGWLCGEFFDSAFSDEEKKRMSDREGDNVFLLDVSDALLYFSEDTVEMGGWNVYADRMAKPTAYAKSKGCIASSKYGTAHWWLRSPGIECCAAHVNSYGIVDDFGIAVNVEEYCIRPAILIRL